MKIINRMLGNFDKQQFAMFMSSFVLIFCSFALTTPSLVDLLNANIFTTLLTLLIVQGCGWWLLSSIKNSNAKTTQGSKHKTS
ncbi:MULTISPECIES: hypothetical protein [Vibrio]|uniref:hypothetical protein n=1 Tax=Vibrio TaxID=662 RepID=UPI00084188DA|nr:MULTISPECIES: hypothetical protein [Vibrio]ODM56886.1 hypothetical protein BC455_18675 [Vibrio harveyi]USD58473.1 hypothetical protein J4N44_27660 [Vibrio sp. SCSIO 43155]